MKKLLTACAACVLAGMVSAQVESVNIVGYSSFNLPASSYSMVAPVFVNIGGQPLKVNECITGSFSAGDYLYFWDVTTQNTEIILEYLDDTYDVTGTIPMGPGWAQDGYMYSEIEVVPGAGFWIQTASGVDAAFTQAGEVDLAEKVLSFEGDGKYTMAANPFPMEVKVNDPAWVDFEAGDYLYFWDVTTQNTEIILEYLAETYDVTGTIPMGPGWAQDGYMYSELPLAMGAGFWVQKVSSGTGSATL